MAEDVLVIGAGPAGIACAYFLKQHGITYKVVDKSDVIADTWAHLYPSLKLNTSRYFSHMPGKPFPWKYGVFPSGRQYHAYLVEFAQEQKLNIELGVEVRQVLPEGDGYRVETSQGTHWYPIVIVATGRFGKPFTPYIPGLDDFKGRVLHASEYHSAKPFRDQRVMVVGSGPSGLDIAVDLGQHHGPQNPALLATRTGIVLKRRFPFGLSKHGWMLLAQKLPGPIGRFLVDKVAEIGYRPAALRGIKAPPQGQDSSSAATRGPELINAVRAGQVICIDAPMQFYEHEARLQNGECVQIDTVILGTGYRPALDFLSALTNITMTGKPGEFWPERYQSQPYDLNPAAMQYRATYDLGPELDAQWSVLDREIKPYPGLFLVGVYYKGKGATYNFNAEGEIAAVQIRQRLARTKQGAGPETAYSS
jgi:putative flavoprotein involved in K+ transport